MIEQMDDPDTAEHLSWLIRMIPDYWEIPNAGYRIDVKDEGSAGGEAAEAVTAPHGGVVDRDRGCIATSSTGRILCG